MLIYTLHYILRLHYLYSLLILNRGTYVHTAYMIHLHTCIPVKGQCFFNIILFHPQFNQFYVQPQSRRREIVIVLCACAPVRMRAHSSLQCNSVIQSGNLLLCTIALYVMSTAIVCNIRIKDDMVSLRVRASTYLSFGVRTLYVGYACILCCYQDLVIIFVQLSRSASGVGLKAYYMPAPILLEHIILKLITPTLITFFKKIQNLVVGCNEIYKSICK